MPKTGDRLRLPHGRYRLDTLIGASSFGEVWAARTTMGKPVAIKFVRADTMDQAAPEDRSRWMEGLRKEAEFLRCLSRQETHHIVRPVDAGDWQGLPVLVMERMAGNLLDHVLDLRREGRRPPLPLIIDWMGQINTALAAIHRHGWRYLDLKPGNLLLSTDSKIIKAADFGTNRPRRQAGGHSFAGTVGWQAPEQFVPTGQDENGYVYHTDHRADYFALGLVFYFLVTGGEVLRYACDCQEVFRQRGEEGARSLRERVGAAITVEECALFLRCLGVEEEDATWRPGFGTDNPCRNASRSPARLSLALLESLLATNPGDRPPNNSVIERRLSAIRQAMEKQQRISRERSVSRPRPWKWWLALPVTAGIAIWIAWNGDAIQAMVEQFAASPSSSLQADQYEFSQVAPSARPIIYSAKKRIIDPLLPAMTTPSKSP